jgi:hypothetical protein
LIAYLIAWVENSCLLAEPKRAYDEGAMSLLQQSYSEVDDAAKGEELTRGTSHIVWATIIAAIAVSVAIVGYAVGTQEKPVAAMSIARATAHFVHRENSGFDAAGAAVPKDSFDQVLVFSHVQLHNQSKNPLFVRQVLTNLSTNDGIVSSYAAPQRDYERLFQAYPELAPLHGNALPMEATIPAGETVEGDFVSSFHMTREQWNARKGLNYTVGFQYQPDMTVAGPATVEVK